MITRITTERNLSRNVNERGKEIENALLVQNKTTHRSLQRNITFLKWLKRITTVVVPSAPPYRKKHWASFRIKLRSACE